MLRGALYGLLLAVAVAAAVLSFTALRDLAELCAFAVGTAWLLPLVVDAGAAAGTLAWLSRTGRARVFGRALALVLLGLSVVGNALGHVLAATEAKPPILVVVVVSAVAPAVLGAVVHLAVLAGRKPLVVDQPTADAQLDVLAGDEPGAPLRRVSDLVDGQVDDEVPDPDRAAELIEAGLGRRRLAAELGISETAARNLIDEHRERVPA